MIQKNDTSKAAVAYGKTLETPITYDYVWTVYENIAEVKAANDLLTDDEILKVRNAERLSNARQKALKAALDAAGIVKPTAENDSQIALRDMVKTLLTAKLPDGSRKYSEDKAREIASATLGVDWAE